MIVSWFKDNLPLLRWLDLLDITIVTFLIYRLLLITKGTKTPQILLGLAVIGIVFGFSSALELRTLHAIFASVFDNLFIIAIILFQSDIRRILSQVGRTSWFSRVDSYKDPEFIEEIVKSAISLANRKIGALIVLEKDADVTEFTDAGIVVDSVFTRELLTSIFLPVSPIHDGAVIIRKGRIFMAACFLPLSMSATTNKSMGTRHRAAVGLSEETDSICLIVSEENGSVSIASQGKMIHQLDSGQLRKALLEYL